MVSWTCHLDTAESHSEGRLDQVGLWGVILIAVSDGGRPSLIVGSMHAWF